MERVTVWVGRGGWAFEEQTDSPGEYLRGLQVGHPSLFRPGVKCKITKASGETFEPNLEDFGIFIPHVVETVKPPAIEEEE